MAKVKICFKMPTGGYDKGEIIAIDEKEISERKWTNIVDIVERMEEKKGGK